MIVGRRLSWHIILRYTGRAVVIHVLFALLVIVGYRLFDAEWMAVPAMPVSVLAAALGVLLAFRNGSAYDRWWEARTLWGGVVNYSRTFARQLLTLLPRPGREAGDTLTELELAPPSSRLLRTAVDRSSRLVTVEGTRASDGAVRDQFGQARVHPEQGSPRERIAALGTSVEALGESRGVVTSMKEDITEDARELVYAQMGFVNALRCHLRRQDPLPEIVPFFRPAVIEALRDEQNVPSAILLWMGTRLRRIYGQVTDTQKVLFLHVTMDRTLSELTNLLGACERIKNTTLPRQYDILLLAMTRAYLVLLPLGVVKELGWLTPLVTAVIAFLFIGLDAVGRDVETPFEDDVSDTPMTALCRTIEINLRQMLGETELPPPVQPQNGILY
ncbi:bestrophin family protein [Myxococcus sp. Y35]|uniref:bestrophin family protein n=1 Tax=Pseudomyxococcus flavus TaxID=3115648 RepID=UPI003CF9E302